MLLGLLSLSVGRHYGAVVRLAADDWLHLWVPLTGASLAAVNLISGYHKSCCGLQYACYAICALKKVMCYFLLWNIGNRQAAPLLYWQVVAMTPAILRIMLPL
uniref:Uncharacterized protein n=1 Tax=Sphaerodactylus townsendi TaxID=933632 RepID=A0ACB8FFW9_9SAUR